MPVNDMNSMLMQFMELFGDGGGFAPGGPGGNLLGQQAGFVSGMPMAMSPEFGPTLAEMLSTGAPIDTAGLEAGARSEAERFFTDRSADINERMAARGKGGSSAQTAALSRAAGRGSTMLGESLGRIRAGAGEAARGRRMGALSSALSEGSLGLQGRQAQAGAGMDLMKLLSSMGGQGAPGGRARAASPGGAPAFHPGPSKARPAARAARPASRAQFDTGKWFGDIAKRMAFSEGLQRRTMAPRSESGFWDSPELMGMPMGPSGDAFMAGFKPSQFANMSSGMTGNPTAALQQQKIQAALMSMLMGGG